MLQRPPPLMRILRPPSRVALEQQSFRPGRRGEYGRHGAGRPCTNHGNTAAQAIARLSREGFRAGHGTQKSHSGLE